MNIDKHTHSNRSHENMENEVQGSPFVLAKDNEVKSSGLDGTHSKSDLEQ